MPCVASIAAQDSPSVGEEQREGGMMTEPTKPADDAKRWRRPKEKPETDADVEAWIDIDNGRGSVYRSWTAFHCGNGEWYDGRPPVRVKVLAWRPIAPPDLPSWLKKREIVE